MNTFGADTTPMKWIMRLAAVLVVWVLYSLSDKLSALQNEHTQLLSIFQVDCYNHAELVQERTIRALQQQRCLQKKLNPEDKP
jgi:hypothetical protein